ncbi:MULTISPECIES: type II toxin-antitoxin system RelE family toxin [Achromobacter]|uniref:Plasmid stabilization system n=1 Tax=Achromobacter xylosoxidans (strain A8) TaxID=762376 RepID=E3HQR3_ACHXA|nr:type II toxin-antitoxin system RelE/ParE family toxin [Achromobacter xylosoxidans]ADP14721.1 plasmid stabilization system [Achromobacter xylosoxidans A8]
MFSINWTKTAVKQLRKISPVDQSRIVEEVAELEMFPASRNVKALTNHQYGFRLRIGQYRVLFDVAAVVRIIEIQEVKRRDDHTY